MNNVELYYTPPKQEIFDELKKISMDFWQEKYPEDEHRYYAQYYAQSKIERIKDLQNIGDNFMYILAMFDTYNQREVISKLTDETKEAIRLRIIIGIKFETLLAKDVNYLKIIGLL
jgi:hypothetical protein